MDSGGEEDIEEIIRIRGIHAGMGWLSDQVQSRRTEKQKLIALMDGQGALWDTFAMHFNDAL